MEFVYHSPWFRNSKNMEVILLSIALSQSWEDLVHRFLMKFTSYSEFKQLIQYYSLNSGGGRNRYSHWSHGSTNFFDICTKSMVWLHQSFEIFTVIYLILP